MATIADQLPEKGSSAAPVKLAWSTIGWFAGLLIVVYLPILSHLVQQWATDEDAGHGFFVPVVAGYMVWTRREELQKIDLKPAGWGILIMLWGAAQGWVGLLGAELFLQRSSILITLVGILFTLGGVPLVRALLFPLALLPFMIPLPAVI
jgi:exosortase